MLFLEALPAVFFLALLFPIPESPRWLIQAGRETDARRTLNRIGGTEYADEEVAAVNGVLRDELGTFSELFARTYRLPLLIAVVIMFASQFSGINVILYYSTEIFRAEAKLIDALSQSLEMAAKAADLSKGRDKAAAALAALQAPELAGKFDSGEVRRSPPRWKVHATRTRWSRCAGAAADARRIINRGPLAAP